MFNFTLDLPRRVRRTLNSCALVVKAKPAWAVLVAISVGICIFVSFVPLFVPNYEFNQFHGKQFDTLGASNLPLGCNLSTWGIGDGAKRICLGAIPHEVPCIILSLGSRGDWSYEQDAFASTTCEIHTFDCTGEFQVPPKLRSRTTFHHQCLGPYVPRLGVSESKFVSWSQMVKEVGADTHNIAHLKMDIEGSEFAIFTEMSHLEAHGTLPVQITFEFHLPQLTTLERISNGASVQQQLMQQLRGMGYRLAARDDNSARACCTELLIVQDGREFGSN